VSPRILSGKAGGMAGDKATYNIGAKSTQETHISGQQEAGLGSGTPAT